MKKSIIILFLIVTTIFMTSLVSADSQNVNVNVNVVNNNASSAPVYTEPAYTSRPDSSYVGRKAGREIGLFGAGEDDLKLFIGASWLPAKGAFLANGTTSQGTIPVGIGLEYLIMDNIGIKGYFGWMSFGKTTFTEVIAEGAGTYSYTDWDGTTTTVTYTARTEKNYEIESGLFLAEVSGVFHLFPKRKLDIYAQANIGYTGIYTTVKDPVTDSTLKDGITGDFWYISAGPGVAYYFKDWYVAFDINFVLGLGKTAKDAAAQKLDFNRDFYTMNLTAGFVF